MHDLFLPYQVSFDPDSSTYCCTGTDRDGEEFGAGSGVTPEVARRRLRETVLESLATDASDGNDFTPGFVRTPKG